VLTWLGGRQRRSSWGCALYIPLSMLSMNPSFIIGINNICKSNCCSWRGRGGEVDRDGQEECCPCGETLCLRVRWAFDEEGCDEQKS